MVPGRGFLWTVSRVLGRDRRVKWRGSAGGGDHRKEKKEGAHGAILVSFQFRAIRE